MADSALFRLPDDYKLDDIDIFAFRGVQKHIPGYGYAEIKQLSAYDWFYTYLPAMSAMSKHFSDVFGEISMLEKLATPEGVSSLREMFIHTFMREKVRRMFLLACKRIGVFRGSLRRFMRAASIGDIFEIFYLMYIFNTEGLKKKFTFLTSALSTVRNMTSATSSSNARTGDGFGKMRIVERIDVEGWRERCRN